MADESRQARPPEEPHRDEGTELAQSFLRGLAAGGATGRKGGTGPSRRRPLRRRRRGDDEPQFSGAHPGERDPQTLGAEMSRMIDDRGWGLDLRVRGVFARWPEMVGPEVGSHSRPESLVDGVLVVRTESTAWATQLKLLAPAVVKRLNTELGEGTVTVVEVRGPQGPSWKHGRLGTRDGRGPRDTYG